MQWELKYRENSTKKLNTIVASKEVIIKSIVELMNRYKKLKLKLREKNKNA